MIIESTITALRDTAIVQELLDIVSNWRGEGSVSSWRSEGSAGSQLFWRLRQIVSSSGDIETRYRWQSFEDDMRRQTTVLTPYELARTFGMLPAFEASNYYARSRMIDRLRLDCDFPAAELLRLEEERRVTSLTPAQREQHEAEQNRKRKHDEMVWQQMMQPQQDPHISEMQAKISAGQPRKMLDQSTLEAARELARSRGVDPSRKGPIEMDADDVDQAILFAQLLSHDRSCDLFRGQADADWKPIPGAFRQKDGLASLRWKRFRDWARRQPLLVSILEDEKKLAAVGQHYGIPTYLLDFTLNPRTAAFFATHDSEIKAAKGSIFCLWSGALDGAYHHYPGYMRYHDLVPQVERVQVEGLFRMQAQEGSFVYTNLKDWSSAFRMDVIRFPRGRPMAYPALADIYPDVLSNMESAVAEYFSEEKIWLENL